MSGDWTASDGRTTYTFTNEEFQSSFNAYGFNQNILETVERSTAAFNELLAKQPSPVNRRQEIERELDIIRGRVPTPKGYRVDSLRVKRLMQELKQLELKN
jgi:hypothetical protein